MPETAAETTRSSQLEASMSPWGHVPEPPDWDREALAELCVQVQGIPAPTFDEGERADWVAGWLKALDPRLEVWRDDAPNVYARLPGKADPGSPGLALSAHLDTVFPAETDLSLRREGQRLHGPGVGDNSMGVAGLLGMAQALCRRPEPPPCDLYLVANAGEEGLGDLAGMRRACTELEDRVGAYLVIEGSKHELWPITHQALGSKRYRILAEASGGHSWGDFGRPSAIHVLAGLAAEIAAWRVPADPRSSFNIGRIEGGTSVNTIAERAELLLDLRSEDPDTLAKLAERAEALVAKHAAALGENTSAALSLEVVGDRPAGAIPAEHPLAQMAEAALKAEGVEPNRISRRLSSTDANLPLSLGIPAITLHLTGGGNAHRLDEWIDLRDLPIGMSQLWRTCWSAAAWLAES